jgi:1-aminocyclopropane-1-carboxylate deaminase
MESMGTPVKTVEENCFQIMNREQLRPVVSPLQPSPVEILSIRGRDIYIKRDDLLRLENSNVSGNKARKMLALNQLPAKDFPTYLISYGGSQSNAMLALAAIVQSKNNELNNKRHPETPTGYERELDCKVELSPQHVTSHPVSQKRFIYYSKKLPRFLKKNPSGNFFRAKTLGMEMIELSNDKFHDLFGGAWGGKHAVPMELLPPGSGDSIWVRTNYRL